MNQNSGKHGPAGTIARLLITKNFSDRILFNPALTSVDKIRLTRQCACETVRTFYTNVSLAPEDARVLREVARNLMIFFKSIVQADEAGHILIGEMIADRYRLCSHSVDVSFYSLLLAGSLKEHKVYRLGEEQLESLCLGSLLHDIGKKLIEQKILEKNTPLTKDEFNTVKQHPALGVEIASHANEFNEDTLNVIAQHHEQWEGGGYPGNLSLQQITPLARIVGIADSFDALTTVKPYRPAFSPFDALALMKRKMVDKFYHLYLDIFIQSLGRVMVS
jgi:putative nucleotidyltransferase with HDIG domain